jgi:maltose O-acetyltransferase
MLFRAYSVVCDVLIRTHSWAKGAALFPDAVNLQIDARTNIKYPHNVRLGADVIIGADTEIGAMASVDIGDLVRISRGVTIETATLDLTSGLPYRHKAEPIVLGRGVWLGAGVTVLGGVTIGEGAVIGAGTVVAHDVTAGAVVVGASARVFPNRIQT